MLLTNAEARQTPHPPPEQLAAYGEGTVTSRNAHALAAHAAACPQCLADLEVVEAFAISPAEPIKLGKLRVTWVRDAIALTFAAPEEASGPEAEPRSPLVAAPLAGKATPLRPRSRVSTILDEIRQALEDHVRNLDRVRLVADALRARSPEEMEPGMLEQIAGLTRLNRELSAAHAELVGRLRELHDRVRWERHSEPLPIAARDHEVRLQLRGRSPDETLMQLRLARTVDSTPVVGIELRLEAEGESPLTAITDSAGEALLHLSPGSSRLVIASPIDAELQISL